MKRSSGFATAAIAAMLMHGIGLVNETRKAKPKDPNEDPEGATKVVVEDTPPEPPAPVYVESRQARRLREREAAKRVGKHETIHGRKANKSRLYPYAR